MSELTYMYTVRVYTIASTFKIKHTCMQTSILVQARVNNRGEDIVGLPTHAMNPLAIWIDVKQSIILFSSGILK